MNRINVTKCMLFASLFLGMAFFSSCQEDLTEGTTNTENPEVSEELDPALSPLEQKEKLEEIAIEFMNQMPASDFQELADFSQYINNRYGEQYEWDSVGDWAKRCFEASLEALETETTGTHTDTWEEYSYIDNYFYNNYKLLLLASNFTGHFKAENGIWKRSDANNLQFDFYGQTGKKCTLKLETAGNVKNVYVTNMDDHQNTTSSSSDYTYIYNHYYDRAQCTIGVPDTLIISLCEGDSQIVKNTIKTDLSNLSGEEFDLSKSSVNMSSLLELNNGYKFKTSQVGYTANTKASATFEMSKNDVPLLTLAIAADPKDIPACNLSTFTSQDFDIEDMDTTEQVNVKNVFVKLDLMGKLQFQGTLSDVRKFAEYMDAANHCSRSIDYKSYINLANALTHVDLYFNNTATKQATVKIETFEEAYWYGETNWEAEPVLYFNDGSSYSTFEVFFNKKDFKNVINTFIELVNNFAKLGEGPTEIEIE